MPHRSLALGGVLAAACLLPPPAAHAGPAPAQVGAQEPRPAGLPQPPSPRREGLPTVLALVALLGVASMQVRVLLAEPGPEPQVEPELTPPSAPT